MNAGAAIDRDPLATEAFGDRSYEAAALTVANRIRQRLGLSKANRLLKGYRGDKRWGNPVVFTIGAGAPLIVARLEQDEHRIVVDALRGEQLVEHAFALTRGSAVEQFLGRFEAGRYPALEAR